jgi:aryl-alcohol dehydrogenase-like predicted oxidoreductase
LIPGEQLVGTVRPARRSFDGCDWEVLLKTRKLGSFGPEISLVGYGSWEAGGKAWGDNPPDDEVVGAMRSAIDAGVNWIDTAEVYGGGRSEELVGEAVKGNDETLVFTKVAPKPAGSGFHRAGVRSAAEASLGRLEREPIDLLQLHWQDRSIPVEETWEAMASLVEDGLVRWIGLSNFGRELIERCERIRHVDSVQPQFSMLMRSARDELFPFCESNGTGIICYGPLAYGLLTGRFTKDTKFGKNDWRGGGHGVGYYKNLFAPGKFEDNIDKVEELRPVAKGIRVSLPQLALAWAFHQPGVTGVIAGSRSADHVRDNAGAGDVTLAQKDIDEIESVLRR